MMKAEFEYSPIPARALAAMKDFFPDEERIAARCAAFTDVRPRPGDSEGATETLDGATFTHHFVEAPGDHETVRFHYAEAGTGEPIVFLHGLPDSWYQWHHQMAALAAEYRVIAVDLKGYGQSEKSPGDYRHEGAAEQLFGALQMIGAERFNLVTHDRGTVQADFIAANHPDAVLRYGRGEQHLHHFHSDLAPQAEIFAEAPWTGVMNDRAHFVVWLYTWITKYNVPDTELRRVIQEYSYPGIDRAVPRYFHSSTFRQEWLQRRRRLLRQWTCPVLLIQGYDSKTQPREYYNDPGQYLPNAKDAGVVFIDAGHFWPMERPSEVTDAIRQLLRM
jgi:pimeloyl-ACP methyl ester carboxylesterase